MAEADDYLVTTQELGQIIDAGQRAYREGRLKMPEGDERRGVEELAELAHEQWSVWMKYLFSKCSSPYTRDDFRRPMPGDVVIPAWAVERWRRQLATPYADLPEEEKASDRTEAYKVLGVVDGLGGLRGD